MATQSWRANGNSTVLSQKILRDAIYKDPRVQQALVNYINSLHLDRENDPNRALTLFDNALRDFTRDCHTKITQGFTANQLGQKNYDPNSLQDPLSPLNLFLDNQMEIIIDDIAAQTIMQSTMADEENVEEDEDENNDDYSEDTSQKDDQDTTQSTTPIIADLEKCAVVGVALKLLDDADPKMIETADKAVENAFHKVTGTKEGDMREIKSELKSAEEEVKKEFAPQYTPHPKEEGK